MFRIFDGKVPTTLAVLSLALLFASVLMFALNTGDFPRTIIIHFDAFRGIDLFGSVSDVWWTIGIAAGFMVMNLLLAWEFFHRERAISYILIGANALLSLILFIALATIISVNI